MLFGRIALELINPQIMRFLIDTATYVGDGVAWDATNDLRADLVLHLLKLDLGFHNARTPGELIERVDGDVGQLNTKSCVFLHLLFGPSLVRALNLFSLDSFTEE